VKLTHRRQNHLVHRILSPNGNKFRGYLHLRLELCHSGTGWHAGVGIHRLTVVFPRPSPMRLLQNRLQSFRGFATVEVEYVLGVGHGTHGLKIPVPELPLLVDVFVENTE
jgi:hypothetical protein